MLVALTGGGTGGHIYPALEVGAYAEDLGAEIIYLGSLRGQEGRICSVRKVEFWGFDTHPVYSLKSVRGWRAVAKFLRATLEAKKLLADRRPDVVFSTGGYSAAPVVAAARSRRIPFVIHEANSVPGRSNRMFAKNANAFTCSFRSTIDYVPGAVRTGQPIRGELREAAEGAHSPASPPLVFVVGGSQGSMFLNDTVPQAATLIREDATVLLSTGRDNYEKVKAKASSNLDGKFGVEPYLETDALVRVYKGTSLVVGRSGGILAEFALFGLPGVLVPLPTSADDHQLKNAQEFAEFGGAEVLEQHNATPEAMASAIDGWIKDSQRRLRASAALKQWDQPNATEEIVRILQTAAVATR